MGVWLQLGSQSTSTCLHILIAEHSREFVSNLERGRLKFKKLIIAPLTNRSDCVSDSPTNMREQTSTSTKKAKTWMQCAGYETFPPCDGSRQSEQG